MKKLFYLLIISIFSVQGFGQSLTGKILDTNGEALAFATVMLSDQENLELKKVEFTDENGIFKFQDIEENIYQLKIQYLGFPEFIKSDIELISDIILDPIELLEATNELQEVVVKAKRPILEIKSDKMVFNVEGSINATGSDALELLRKAPGVMVDHNENVALLGKAGVKVFIDSKEAPFSNEDLASYLKGLQSDQIDKIEIITNPSSKYDAEGNAGIIDIKLKKKNKNGALTNLSGSFNQGLRTRVNLAANTNVAFGKSNLYVSANIGEGGSEEELSLYREQSGVILDQSGENSNSWKYFSTRLGFDHKINDKHTVGLLFNLNRNDSEYLSIGRTPISRLESRDVIDSILVASSDNQPYSWNHTYNLNYSYNNEQSTTFNVDFDFGRYDRMETSLQPNEYISSEGALLSEGTYETNAPTLIDIYTAKADYETGFLDGKFGTGVKYSRVKTDNTFDFYQVIDDDSVLDPERSNNFVYDEIVYAGYINYSRQFGKLGFQAGLRAEQTESDGILTAMVPTNNDQVKRSYLNFFPSAGVNYPVNEKHNLNFSYSRRLNRPNYRDLNPFVNRLDEITFEKGNPFLNPEYSNNIQLTHTYNYSLNTTFSFGYTTDLIARITDASDVTNSFITRENIAKQHVYSVSVSYPITINDKWTSFVNVTGYRTSNFGTFEEGKEIDLTANTFNFYNQNSIRLPNNWNLEISGWYLSPSIWEGNFKMDQMWSMDLGVQKKFMDDKASVKLSISDVFRTNRWSGVTYFGDQFIDASGINDSRRVRISMSIALGRKDVKSRKRKTGLEDEAGRIGS